MKRTHRIYLVPGFLGFARVGKLTRFKHIRRFLAEHLAAMELFNASVLSRPGPTWRGSWFPTRRASRSAGERQAVPQAKKAGSRKKTRQR